MTPSPIVAFYGGEQPDASGRHLATIQRWSDSRLEAVHDYIQWLFPLPERSAYNRDAPLLTAADIQAFRESAALQGRLLDSLRRMLAFYGLVLDEQGDAPRISPAPDFPPQPHDWLSPGNHNLLRLTRILRSLALLGLPGHARALLTCLEGVERQYPDAIGPVTMCHWWAAVAISEKSETI